MTNMLTIADTHLGINYPYSKRDKTGKHNRLRDIYNIFADEIYGDRYKLWDVAVHAGDFFDEYKLDGEVLETASQIINLIEHGRKPFYILKGNHDEDNKFSVLEHYRHFNLKYCKFITNNLVKNFENILMFFIPWGSLLEVKGRLRSVVNEINSVTSRNLFRILVGHFPVKGTEYSKTICKEGILKSDIEYLTENKIVDVVLLGHHHKFQYICPKAMYIGSPFQKDFGEMGESHGYHIIEVENDFYTTFYPSKAPKFIEMTSSQASKMVLNDDVKGAVVRIMFGGNITQYPDEMKSVRQNVLNAGARHVVSKIIKPKKTAAIGPIASNLSPELMVEKYVMDTVPPPKKLDKNMVVEFGMRILEEVRKRGKV